MENAKPSTNTSQLRQRRMSLVKFIRGWNPEDGPKPESEEWWLRLDVRNALRKAVERSKKEAEG